MSSATKRLASQWAIAIAAGAIGLLPAISQAGGRLFLSQDRAVNIGTLEPGFQLAGDRGGVLPTVVGGTLYSGLGVMPEAGLVPLQAPQIDGQVTHSFRPSAMNNHGRIVGRMSTASFVSHAVLWDNAAAVPTILPTLSGPGLSNVNTRALSISDTGIIMGVASGNGISGDAVVRWHEGNVTRLDAFRGYDDMTYQPQAINNSGAVVGNVLAGEGRQFVGYRAVRWSGDSTEAVELRGSGVAAGSMTVRVYDINNSGVTVGYDTRVIRTIHYGYQAVYWPADSADPVVLGNIGQYTSDGYTGDVRATAINDAGDIVGRSQVYRSNGTVLGTHALRWAAGTTTPQILQTVTASPNPSAGFVGYPMDVNNLNYVVGTSFQNGDGLDFDYAVLWKPDGTGVRLSSYLDSSEAGIKLQTVESISDTGWIAGRTTDEKAYLLLVPEAGTYGRGDANFDTQIDFDDLLLLAQHYGQANPDKAVNVADFNLDGMVDFSDLLALAQHYGQAATNLAEGTGISADFAADWALAQSIVPEPSLLAGLSLGALLVGRRRRV